jgi:hypothetical protein
VSFLPLTAAFFKTLGQLENKFKKFSSDLLTAGKNFNYFWIFLKFFLFLCNVATNCLDLSGEPTKRKVKIQKKITKSTIIYI